MSLKNFSEFINESEVKSGDDEDFNDGSNKKLDKEVDDYIEDNNDICPRCKEPLGDCKCEDEDYWSTKNAHRAPKGKEVKVKPKQNFKK